ECVWSVLWFSGEQFFELLLIVGMAGVQAQCNLPASCLSAGLLPKTGLPNEVAAEFRLTRSAHDQDYRGAVRGGRLGRGGQVRGRNEEEHAGEVSTPLHFGQRFSVCGLHSISIFGLRIV